MIIWIVAIFWFVLFAILKFKIQLRIPVVMTWLCLFGSQTGFMATYFLLERFFYLDREAHLLQIFVFNSATVLFYISILIKEI
ncbi:MAG: hypothetical protein HY776_01695 [Actinobacteria bacterium]|nr:hypothetical protein [Actinomycetota bacterium]